MSKTYAYYLDVDLCRAFTLNFVSNSPLSQRDIRNLIDENFEMLRQQMLEDLIPDWEEMTIGRSERLNHELDEAVDKILVVNQKRTTGDKTSHGVEFYQRSKHHHLLP